MVEYRPLSDDRHDVYLEFTSYAFGPESGPFEYDPEEHDTAATRLGDQRGLFASDAAPDDPPRCVCTHYWFDAHIRGDWHPAPGLAAVASPPEHRRGGNVECLLERSLEEYRNRGDRFSLLWPFRTRFYSRYGWETCSEHRSYTCEPDALRFAAEADLEVGRYRPLEADDHEVLASVYEHQIERYSLAIARNEDWWRYRIARSGETNPYIYAWERADEPRGYVVYTIENEYGDRIMRVRELAFVDHQALLALLAFCANHDSQVEEVRFSLPTDIHLLDFVPDPEDVECTFEPGPMARIVDVVDALGTLSYPAVDVDLSLAVDDPLVGRNDGSFTLEVTAGEPTCEPSVGGHDVDVMLDVGSLTQLVVGFRSAAELDRSGRLEASSKSVDALGRLFPPEDVYLGTTF